MARKPIQGYEVRDQHMGSTKVRSTGHLNQGEMGSTPKTGWGYPRNQGVTKGGPGGINIGKGQTWGYCGEIQPKNTGGWERGVRGVMERKP